MALLALAAPANAIASAAGIVVPAAEAGALAGNTGFTFPNNGLVIVRLVVGASGAGNYQVVRFDGSTPDAAVAVANSTVYLFGPYDPALYSGPGGLMQVNLSVVTGNTVGVYSIPARLGPAGYNGKHQPFQTNTTFTDS